MIADPSLIEQNLEQMDLLRQVCPWGDEYLEAIITERDTRGSLVWLQADGRRAAA